jgi:flavin reductase (DIM6/NTAB) family NADH-FMN oxidoreductase RutF
MNDGLAPLFRRLISGVYVVGVSNGQRQNAFTAAWIMQVSFDPLLLALTINPNHASYQLLKDGGGFVVNVLSREQLDIARHFGTHSGRDFDKLAGVKWRAGRLGAPILSEALAYFECQLADSMRAGDHEIVIGRVLDGAILAPDAIPLMYAETGDLDGSSELYPAGFSNRAARQ